MVDIGLIRRMQLEKIKGELKILQTSYYDPFGDNVLYDAAREVIRDIIDELDNEFG